MDKTREIVSFFPRHDETETGCLMTCGSGNHVALVQGPGCDPARRPYMFSRLRCHSYLDRLTRRTASGLPVARIFEQSDNFGRCRASSERHLGPGAFPEPVSIERKLMSGCAPMESVSTMPRGATRSADIAGWTEVVIQRGSRTLCNVSFGYERAEVNSSIMWSGAVSDGFGLLKSSGTISVGCARGRRGLSELDGSGFSCSNNNEVTK
jgi:hypothetical protein